MNQRQENQMEQDNQQNIVEVEEGLCKAIIIIDEKLTETKTKTKKKAKKIIVFNVQDETQFYSSGKITREVVLQENINYQYRAIKSYQIENNEIIVGKYGISIKKLPSIELDLEDETLPVQFLKYFEKERIFDQTNFNFKVCGFLKVSDQTNPNRYAIYNMDQPSTIKENLRLENKKVLVDEYQEEANLVQKTNNIEPFVLIKITKNTNLQRDYKIPEKYDFTDQKEFPIGYFCRKANGQIEFQNLEFDKIILNNEIKISGINIKGLNIEISNIFVYVCYQFQIKTLLQATPIGILDYKKKSPEQNEITLRLKPGYTIPSIYEGDKISCKHFVVFHIQLQQQFYLSKYPNIEVIFPIVILKNDESEHEYVKNSYFTPEYSEALIDFQQNQENGSFTPCFGQLLESHYS